MIPLSIVCLTACHQRKSWLVYVLFAILYYDILHLIITVILKLRSAERSIRHLVICSIALLQVSGLYCALVL